MIVNIYYDKTAPRIGAKEAQAIVDALAGELGVYGPIVRVKSALGYGRIAYYDSGHRRIMIAARAICVPTVLHELAHYMLDLRGELRERVGRRTFLHGPKFRAELERLHELWDRKRQKRYHEVVNDPIAFAKEIL